MGLFEWIFVSVVILFYFWLMVWSAPRCLEHSKKFKEINARMSEILKEVESKNREKTADPKIQKFVDGDYVWNWNLGYASIYSHEKTRGVFAIDGEYIAKNLADLVPVSFSCFDQIKKSSKESEELREAIGLLSTLAPKMVMDPDHPMKMAREIVRVVNEERKTHTSNEEFQRRLRSIVEGTTFVPSPGPTK